MDLFVGFSMPSPYDECVLFVNVLGYTESYVVSLCIVDYLANKCILPLLKSVENNKSGIKPGCSAYIYYMGQRERNENLKNWKISNFKISKFQNYPKNLSVGWLVFL